MVLRKSTQYASFTGKVFFKVLFRRKDMINKFL